MGMSKIKVFHVEDYKIMRDGIRKLLADDIDIELVGESKNGEDFISALESIELDVLILDIYLDAMEDLNALNGFQICKVVQERYPHIKIIAHSVYDDADRVAAVIKSGALGFVSKKSGFEELLRAVKTVAIGERYICPETSGKLKNLNRFLTGIESNLRGRDEVFSLREREVLNLLSQGKSSKEVAETLFITERTVESHRRNMIEKGKVKNTVELIAYAASLGVIRK
jgi:DNA-binding NarL/FixJ family response regulator